MNDKQKARKVNVSNDQNRVTIDGTVTTFLETKKKKTGNCNKCWWREGATARECDEIPCNPDERADGRHGVFTIKNMPKY